MSKLHNFFHNVNNKVKNINIKNPFTKSKNKHQRTSRLPGNGKNKRLSFKKAYPILNSLKLRWNVPSSVIENLDKYANDRKHNGAVQKVKTNLSTTAYSVIVMTDKSLEESSLSDDGDLGQFSAEIKSKYIEPAVLKTDVDNGKLVVIPSDQTIDQMKSFDAFSEIKFHWGLFLGSFTDVSDSNQVITLKSTVSLAQLITYSKVQPTMSVKDHEMFMNGQSVNPSNSDNSDETSDDNTNASDEQSSNTSDVRQTPPTQNDNSDDNQDNQQNSNGQDTLDIPSLTSNPATNRSNNQNQTNNDNQQQKPSYKNTLPNDDFLSGASNRHPNDSPQSNPQNDQDSNNDNQQNSSMTTNGRTANNIPNNTSANENSYNNHPAASGQAADTQPDYQNSSDQSQQSEQSQSQNDNGEDPALEAAMQGTDDQASDQAFSRTKLNNDQKHPQENPKKFSEDTNNLIHKAYYDNDLNVKIDLSDLRENLAGTHPFQFELKKIVPGDKAAHFKNILNIDLAQKNAKLRQLHEQNIQRIINNAMDTLNSASERTRQILNPDDKHTRAYKDKQRIENQYKYDKKKVGTYKNDQIHKLKGRYKENQQSAVKEAAEQARIQYDQEHHDKLQAQINKFHELATAPADKEHAARLRKFQVKRSKIAKQVLSDVVRRMSSRAHNIYEIYRDKERAVYDRDQSDIKQTIAKYFNKEIDRANEITYGKKHDHQIEELKKKNQSLIEDYRQRIANLREGSRNDRINAVKNEQARTKALIRNNSMLRKQWEDAEKQARKAGHTIPAKYAHELKMRDERYRDLQQQNKEDNERYNHQLDNLTKSIRRQSTDFQTKTQTKNWYWLAVGGVLGIILLISGLAIGHNNSHTQTKYIHVGIPESREASGDSGNHTTINNGNDQPSTNKSSSTNGGTKTSKTTKSGAKYTNYDNGVNRSLMTRRPSKRSGLYIGTSTDHHPTSYMYVTHKHMYNKGDTVTGYKGHSKVHLTVTRVAGKMTFVRDPTNNAYYEFNLY